MVPAAGPVPPLWRADRRPAGGKGAGVDRALAAAGQRRGIRLPHRALASLGADEPADAGSPTREAGRPRPVAAAVLKEISGGPARASLRALARAGAQPAAGADRSCRRSLRPARREPRRSAAALSRPRTRLRP